MKNILLKLGDFFRNISRFFYRHSGVCWNCGARCGMQSIYARRLLWCTHCYDRWSYHIPDQELEFSWRYLGKPIKRNTSLMNYVDDGAIGSGG